jgi:signal transduction histidine kinase/CheY-like chemotaxis protein
MEKQMAVQIDYPTASGRWFEISVHPSLSGLSVYCQDATARHRAQRRLAVQNAVSFILADSTSLEEAAPSILRSICECLGWVYGAVWTVDQEEDEGGEEKKVLRCLETWEDGETDLCAFTDITRRFAFEANVGLPGRVLASASAHWIGDVTRDRNFPRALVAQAVGLHSAFGIPITLENEVLAVVEFFSHAIYEPDDDLLSLMGAVGHQIAQFIRRKRAEAELKEAKRGAELANQAKDDFLATLSHELRTPLTPVLISLQSLEEDERLPADVREDMRMMRQNVQLEARLIDDLLDLTRIVRGKIQLHPSAVDIHALLEHAVRLFAMDAKQKQQTISLDMSASGRWVWGDAARLEQIFWNILKNAIKFTPPGGWIRIETTDAGGKLAIRISDSGIGIEPSLLPIIFNAFEQGGREMTHRYGGLGLGLAISKAFIEVHGGTIGAVSEGKDKGTTFTIELVPMALPTPQLQPRPREMEPTHSTGALRILLVEDHEQSAWVLRRLLESFDHAVQTAGTVESAKRAAASSKFDLVISDLGLPDGTGHELMVQLRELYGLTGIALSGYGMDQDIERSKQCGFVKHLIKPVSLQQLEEAIEMARGK